MGLHKASRAFTIGLCKALNTGLKGFAIGALLQDFAMGFIKPLELCYDAFQSL